MVDDSIKCDFIYCLKRYLEARKAIRAPVIIQTNIIGTTAAKPTYAELKTYEYVYASIIWNAVTGNMKTMQNVYNPILAPIAGTGLILTHAIKWSNISLTLRKSIMQNTTTTIKTVAQTSCGR